MFLQVFIAVGMCLLSGCLARNRGIHLAEPLPYTVRVIGIQAQLHRPMVGIYESKALRWAQLP